MRREEKRAVLALFPDALQAFIIPKLNELNDLRSRALGSATLRLRECEALGSDGWFLREWVKVTEVDPILDLERQIRALEAYLAPRAELGGTSSEDRIARAREASVVEVAEAGGLKLRRSGKLFYTRCPFHDEKTASLCLYPHNQSFYCFGCNTGGDVIAFTRQVLGLSFKESVRYLTPSYG